MTQTLSRRRFLTISAACTLCATQAQATEVVRWQGRALGAGASMQLSGLSQHQAHPVIRAVEQELNRLENIFSLYRDGSEIVRLNTSGQLAAPSADLLHVLSLSGSMNAATLGAFDPTVQPVWRALAKGDDPASARSAVGWQHVEFDAGMVRFTRADMALTLNGIAQGYITDRIAALLRDRGLDNVLIDMGEIAAIGPRPDGRDWRAGVSQPDGRIVHHVALRDRAIATSAPDGTIFPTADNAGHIIDPTAILNGTQHKLVSVSAPSAAVADGLSTACCLLVADAARAAVAAFGGAEIEVML
ncbi:FAD:protein FMN transferase [Sulfitobacter sp. JL08]|uniref:FAD:protein FMN transferase n=1 Tax=Sulfitobacter sp. JL08 TaxID=2070369 RepID=UPI000E09F438|nr:FAD:protein FMN transferase [Sulfitobacter sp. JL08]AXI53607.1 FAD:protein FMN transferase [Sulfitobacter sp. JL08]